MSAAEPPHDLGPSLSALEAGSFTAQAFFDGDRLDLTLAGSAELDARAKLGALLADLHAAALRRGIKEVHLQLKELVFINSSCLKELVTWILQVQDAPDEPRYQIHLHVKKTLAWQARALRPLVAIGQGHVFLLT